MSEKKSWDIQPRRKPAPAPVPIPARPASQTRVPFQKSARAVQKPPRRKFLQKKVRRVPEPKPQLIRKQPPVPMGKDREPLKHRRKRARRRSLIIVVIVFLVIVVGLFGSLWLKDVRIQAVIVAGPDDAGVQTIATTMLKGTYKYVVPRDSIFFFPESQIRSAILQQYPDIAAVDISRTSFSTIAIASIPRETAVIWCGATYTPLPPQAPVDASASSTTPVAQPPQPACYSADAQGIIFAPVSPETASSSGELRLYGPLAGSNGADGTSENGLSNGSPIGETIGQASAIPNALQLVKVIKSLGVPIVAFVIRGDEADMYAQSGTRITYVLGHEEVTAQVAEAAFPSLDLNDGSLEYVDLRFEGKAYYKKVGVDDVSTATSTSISE